MNSTEVKTIQAVVSAGITGLLYYLGIVVVPIVVLLIAMIIDYETGMISTWYKSFCWRSLRS